ncbi:MAG: hypothetical protein KJO31_10005 [Gammaproteobacteria bacterium]|nr:hypothetical protein [Gammaproteobacteria bacterium]
MRTNSSVPAKWRFRWAAGVASLVANSVATAGVLLALLAIFTDISLGFALSIAILGVTIMVMVNLIDVVVFRFYHFH